MSHHTLVIMGKFFRNRDFHFKTRLEHSESIPIKKIFRLKIFIFAIFSTYEHHFLKKWLCPQRKVIMGFFEIEVFILRYVLDHSESIPFKKEISTNFFLSWPFSRPMNRSFRKNGSLQSKIIMGQFFRN